MPHFFEPETFNPCLSLLFFHFLFFFISFRCSTNFSLVTRFRDLIVVRAFARCFDACTSRDTVTLMYALIINNFVVWYLSDIETAIGQRGGEKNSLVLIAVDRCLVRKINLEASSTKYFHRKRRGAEKILYMKKNIK